ncbi:glycosyltransferase family 4 protein [Candidatus Poribacteria bacterium]|nr:glycosyltransferase family 4 protein [Candidatus Poribacteria bacterium]
MTSIASLHINDQATWRGGEKQVYYLLRGLNERGHRAELVAQPKSALGERVRELGIRVHSVRMRGEIDVPASRRIAGLVNDGHFDVVHMHTAHAHALGCMACAFNRKPVCVVSRRVDFPINRKPFGLPALKYRWRVDHYIAISEAVKSVLVSGGVSIEKVSIVYSGVEPRNHPGFGVEIRRSLGLPADLSLVGNVGALVDHKGHRFLIEAVPLVLQRIPSTRFVIVGDGELRDSLKSLASQLSVGDVIMFPGFRPDADKYISAFDVFVVPSHMEGLNTSILDAMMLRRPVIGTTAGGIPEIIVNDKTGLLVPPKDPPALAEAIVGLLGNPEKARRLADAGRAMVMNRFTADRMVEGTIAVYQNLLKNR